MRRKKLEKIGKSEKVKREIQCSLNGFRFVFKIEFNEAL